MQTTTRRQTIHTIANRVAAQVSADLRHGVISNGDAYDESYYAMRMQIKDSGVDLSEEHLVHYVRQVAALAIERA